MRNLVNLRATNRILLRAIELLDQDVSLKIGSTRKVTLGFITGKLTHFVNLNEYMS
jgi:hypothetical protein